MTQEEKNLVLIDLCGRLPYGVKIKEEYGDYINVNIHNANVEHLIDRVGYGLDKMVLRPLSSMTNEEKHECQDILGEVVEISDDFIVIIDSSIKSLSYLELEALFSWLNKKMFDYRNLIPKGLALEAKEGIYEIELLDYWLPSQNESDSVTDNTTKITVGCEIRSKTNPDEILSIVSGDCHGDKFECSNGCVLSSKQIKKHYDIYIEENTGTIVIN